MGITGTVIPAIHNHSPKPAPTVFSTAPPKPPAKDEAISGTTTPAARSPNRRPARMIFNIVRTEMLAKDKIISGTTIPATHCRSQRARIIFNIAPLKASVRGKATTGTRTAAILNLKRKQHRNLNKSRANYHQARPHQTPVFLCHQRQSRSVIRALRQTTPQKLMI